jgi:tripartite-type tricarboxylate transporter receptor subunit TctC
LKHAQTSNITPAPAATPYLSRRQALAAVGSLLPASLGWAQSSPYPNKPVRLVVPTPAGTPIDIVSRVYAQRMGEALGQPVVVENKAGATGAVGGQAVLQSAPDGYTLMTLFMPMAVAPAIYPKVPFDLRTAFEPVGQTAWSYNVLVVPSSLAGVQSVKDLVGHLRSGTEQASYASGGHGTPAHLIGALFGLKTDTKALHVPYPTGQSTTNLMAGRHTFMFLAVPSALPGIQSGKLRALAVAADRRVGSLPQVPTMAEQGSPELVARDWQGFAVRRGTPKDVIARLMSALDVARKDVKTVEALASVGADVALGGPDQFGQHVGAEVERWAEVVRAANIKAE